MARNVTNSLAPRINPRDKKAEEEGGEDLTD